ncbi:MAG: hydantoinase B/oxoprolinase family protein [Janthinobacterium lividum]
MTNQTEATSIVDYQAIAALELDSISVEVISNSLTSIVDEMGRMIVRASYSQNIKERQDCSAVIFDIKGRTIAQAEHIPLHLGSLLGISDYVLKSYDLSKVRPGDVFVGNDAYTGGGTHLNDIVFLEPVFLDKQLVAWAANVAHHSDFVDRGHAHIFQEGLRIPPVRLYREGLIEDDILQLILLNCQVPRERINDFRAQMGANRLGIQRMQALCKKYGTHMVLRGAELAMDYSERKTRAGIKEIPDGVYEFSQSFDSDLVPDDLLLRVKIEVKNDEIFFDFANNPPWVRAGINSVYTALFATVLFAVKALVDPNIPANQGFYRPIHVDAPLGSILNAAAPAAVYWRTDVLQRVVDMIFAALAPAIPTRVIAASTGPAVFTVFGTHPRTGKYYVYNESVAGSLGGRYDRDGMDGVQVHTTNTANLPVEALEIEHPLMVEAYELVQDSGGVGAHRGGMTIRRRIRALDHVASVSLGGTCSRVPAWGLFGGEPGSLCRVERGEGVEPLRSRQGQLQPGQSIAIVTAAAGGYGNPAERDVALIERDILEERVSERAARAAYKQFR